MEEFYLQLTLFSRLFIFSRLCAVGEDEGKNLLEVTEESAAKGSFDTGPTFVDSFPPCALSITHSLGLKVSWMCSAAEIQTSVLMPVCTAVTLIEGWSSVWHRRTGRPL